MSDVARLADRLSVTHLLLVTSFALMGLGLLGNAGQMWIILMETSLLGWGITLSDGSVGASRFTMVFHLGAMATLGLVLFLWHRGDAWLNRSLRPAAIILFGAAPIGVPLAILLWWMSRQPDLDDAMEQMPAIAGNRRAAIIVGWLVACVATMLLMLQASTMLSGGIAFAGPASVVAAIPQSLSLLWLLRARRQAFDDSIMPPLPEPGQPWN